MSFVDRAVARVGPSSHDFLPDIFGDVITLDGVHDVLLIDSTSKCEDEVVLERAEGNTRSRNSQAVDLLPLILLDVVDLAEPVDLAVDEGADNVDVALDGAEGVIGVWVNHLGFLIESGKDFIVSVAVFQVLVSSLVATTDQVDAAVLGGDGPGVEWYLKLHLNGPLFELGVVDLKDVGVLLVPLERMHSAGDTRLEAVLDVVVDPEVGFDQGGEVSDDFVGVLVQQSLQLGDILEFIEILFELSIEVQENLLVVSQDRNELLLRDLLCIARGLLKLAILLAEPLIKVGHFGFIVLSE